MRLIGHVGRRPSCFMEAATGERIVAFGRVGKPLENPFFAARLRLPRHPWRRHATAVQRILKPHGVRLVGGNFRYGLAIEQKARVAQIVEPAPGGSRSRAVLPRGNAWCRICPRRGRRSRSTIPIRCRRSCGWHFRATPGPDGAARWSGAAANRSASSSSVRFLF
jgi:hypothetical protein